MTCSSSMSCRSSSRVTLSPLCCMHIGGKLTLHNSSVDVRACGMSEPYRDQEDAVNARQLQLGLDLQATKSMQWTRGEVRACILHTEG